MSSIGAARTRRGVWEWLLVCVGLVFIAMSPPQIWGDAQIRIDSLGKLLGHGQLDAARYSLVGPLFASPLWALHKTEFFNLIVFALGLFALQRIFTPLLGQRATARFCLFILCASEFPLDLRHFYGEPFTAFTIAIGLAGLAIAPANASIFRLAGFGSLIVVGGVNTPAALAGVGLSCAFLAWRRREMRLLAIPALALAGILLEAWLRRGSPFASGYEGDHGFRNDLPFSGRSGFSYPIAFGLLSIFFSFGRGLIFFSPGLFLRLPSSGSGIASIKTIHRSWLLFVAGLFIVYTKWWAWYGGIWFGPRFFLFAAIPAGLVLALRSEASESIAADLATLFAASISLWVGFTALLYGGEALSIPICQIDRYRFEPYCWYAPEYSSLALPLTSPRAFSLRDWIEAGYIVVVAIALLSPLVRRLFRAIVDAARAAWTNRSAA